MHSKISKGFSPGIFEPNYFMRDGLKNAVCKYAGKMHGKMMDFGCGSKPYKNLFGVDEYIGIDYENEGHPHKNEQIDVFYDGKTIPFENGYFDSVLCSEVIEHVFDLPLVLTEINRVTKQNGVLLFTCPFVWSEHEVPHDYARYTRFALEDAFTKAGFEIITIEKTGNFITTMSQMACLYSYISIYPRIKKIFFLRWFYKFFLIFIPNTMGIVLSKLLPRNDDIYLSNIVWAKKK